MSKKIVDYFRVNLVRKRNKRMAARVIKLLAKRPNSYFFAFGVGHFLGEDSILKSIKSAGFTIDHISREETLDYGTFKDFPKIEKAVEESLRTLQYGLSNEVSAAGSRSTHSVFLALLLLIFLLVTDSY
jgi:hypothetical protein